MSAHATDPNAVPDVDRTRWRIDPTSIPVDLDATVRPVGDELELEAETHADHHHLGMTWNRLGMLRTPSKLIVHARLVQDGD